jgi:alpha-galactosidase
LLLLYKDAIAIDQDAAGMQAFRYSNKDSVQTWFRPLQNGDWAVCFINRSSTAKNISFDWKNENVTNNFYSKQLNATTINYKLYDVWTKKDMGSTASQLNTVIPGHDVLMLRLKNK